MITELTVRVWANPRFREASQRTEIAWLKHELGVESEIVISAEEATKLIRAAAILACSEEQQHREAAFRTATCLYDLIPKNTLPLEQALRVILARLGNFPSLETRSDVASAQGLLPLSLVTEELEAAAKRAITINDETLHFTNFQYQLWSSLSSKARVALSAPTSAGKSSYSRIILSRFLAATRHKSLSISFQLAR
jgi:hypothetical protein